MASSTYTMWTCDRCGGDIRELDRNVPVQWVRLLVIRPLRGDINVSEYRKRDMELCHRCREQLEGWITKGEPDGS